MSVNAPAAATPAIASPIPREERLASLDAVRGLAVLGILAMNIRNFGLPIGQFDNPRWPRHQPDDAATSLAPADLLTWLTTNALFEDKMITIFGLLFGAGVVLFADRLARAAISPARAAALHYRRVFWLLLIGLAHAYLLWYGDILNTYALCGLLLWPLRRLRPGPLIGLGVICLLIPVWVRLGPPLWEMVWHDPAQPRPPTSPSLGRRILREALQSEEAAYRGTWTDLFLWRANLNTFWHFTAGATFTLWRSLGQMLIGMGLMRLALFANTWRTGAMLALLLAGWGLGLTLTLIGMAPGIAEALGRAPDASAEAGRLLSRLTWSMRFIGALGVALGHIAALLLLSRWLRGRRLGPLIAVGRMALSNYLMHTLICVLIFDGWAGAQWDRWHMASLYLLVAAIWAAQLLLSPIWLRAFRYGPAEWAWRSLTYWRIEPFRAHRTHA